MRDRVTYARRCVAALEAAGLAVIVVDHGSTWPEAARWLEPMRWTRPPGIWSDDNRHPRDLWRSGGPIATCVPRGERFTVTDCDVVPADDCPADWPAYLSTLLDERPAAVKAGLGLRTSDLPPWFARRDEVQAWESAYQPPIAHPVGTW